MSLITRRFWGLLASGADTVPPVGTASPLTKPVLTLFEEVGGVEEVEGVEVVEGMEEVVVVVGVGV